METVVKTARVKARDIAALKSFFKFLDEEVDLYFISEILQCLGVTRTLNTSSFTQCHITNGIATDLASFMLRESYTFAEILKIFSALSLDPLAISKMDLRWRLQVAEKRKLALAKDRRNPTRLVTWLGEHFLPARVSLGAECMASEPQRKSPAPSSSSCAEWPPLTASSANFAASATPVLWPTLWPGSVRLTSDTLPPGSEDIPLYPSSMQLSGIAEPLPPTSTTCSSSSSVQKSENSFRSPPGTKQIASSPGSVQLSAIAEPLPPISTTCSFSGSEPKSENSDPSPPGTDQIASSPGSATAEPLPPTITTPLPSSSVRQSKTFDSLPAPSIMQSSPKTSSTMQISSNLPSTSSALNMMCEGKHIANCQIVDDVSKSEHFTYASDGTSRQKKHYMERHLVLDNRKPLSLGFSSIASDDANSMLEQTKQTFEDIVNCSNFDMNDDSKCETFKECMSKMKCLMSDRAANMKLFNKKVHEWRKDILCEEDVETHFLYSNAHFLLGLYAATQKAISMKEELIVREMGSLGRDQEAKFKHFNSSSESAGLRAIRTAAEVLGPRGDEKSGARQEWINYCKQMIVKECHSVLQRQLGDFLEGGVFGGDIRDDVKGTIKELYNALLDQITDHQDAMQSKSKRSNCIYSDESDL
ncbi:hypothetical protein PoB_000748600 [Plakobranchus ocellatus]|uniref:Uncharacterized protein n=1 Tax=Plakobranchus ocellatus TaxID=259542 RepID=A0AAV3YF13_9GAST|nr:hypothetical protein PoB_000748600 [Plakobranchus ocellatus]